ncbi:hypothetical protein K501DRAFT_278383 [Backusella circina FSU 941]|nr:hypothetical protein K501DRAFT_278383 [Backusella circina FSU 941]
MITLKFTKHKAKIGDASVFIGIYTVINNYEEIVHQVLIPSKSVAYLTYSFQKMYETNVYYSHDMPVVFFTDNVKGDKNLETAFSSLKSSVNPRMTKGTIPISIYPCWTGTEPYQKVVAYEKIINTNAVQRGSIKVQFTVIKVPGFKLTTPMD